MTLQDLKDIAPIVGACVAVLGLTGLYLTWLSIRRVYQWNRLNAAFTFFPNPLDLDTLEGELDKALAFWRSDAPLDVAVIQALFGDLDLQDYKRFCKAGASEAESESVEDCRSRMMEAGRKLKLYLNLIETYCAAINAGLADERAAYHIFKSKFKHHFGKLSHLIPYVRDIKGSDSILSEFKSVALRWSETKTIQNLYR